MKTNLFNKIGLSIVLSTYGSLCFSVLKIVFADTI